jgi:hypothetical protein
MPLWAESYGARPEVALFERVRERLQQCQAGLDAIERDLRVLSKSGDCVLLLKPTDKRLLVDMRRQWILPAIFQFWYEHGPNRRYTTDKATSERSGPLVEFTNALVSCITDPSLQLSGDTIVKGFASFRPRTWDVEALVAAIKGHDDAKSAQVD